MAAALMTQVPGISDFFCGSAVTYRVQTKQQWLGVPVDILQRFTAESQPTTDALAIGVLEKTPEAAVACAITGHLGPGAASDCDGRIFVSLASRFPEGPAIVARESCRLTATDRVERQLEAAEWMLERLARWLLA
jgi:nicotinamide-nucleotide amidase